jgi:hypothetical protein
MQTILTTRCRLTTSNRRTFSQPITSRPSQQVFLPELIQSQLLPQFTSQPAVSKHARIPQLQFAEPNLNAIDGVVGKDSVLGKQTHGRVLLPILIKHRQTFSPRRFLLIVDLSQLQNRSLRHLARRQPAAFHHAEVSVQLAVFLPPCASQIHLERTMPEPIGLEKGVGLRYSIIPKPAVVATGVRCSIGLKNPKTVPELRKFRLGTWRWPHGFGRTELHLADE